MLNKVPSAKCHSVSSKFNEPYFLGVCTSYLDSPLSNMVATLIQVDLVDGSLLTPFLWSCSASGCTESNSPWEHFWPLEFEW